MTFELYRMLITLATSLPVMMLLGCAVLYIVKPKPNIAPDMAILLFGVLIGLAAAAGLGWLAAVLTI
jgi:hypothetical protein